MPEEIKVHLVFLELLGQMEAMAKMVFLDKMADLEIMALLV